VQMAMQDAIAMFFADYQNFTFHIPIQQFFQYGTVNGHTGYG